MTTPDSLNHYIKCRWCKASKRHGCYTREFAKICRQCVQKFEEMYYGK